MERSVDKTLLKMYQKTIWKELNSFNVRRSKNVLLIIMAINIILVIFDYQFKAKGLWQLNIGYIILNGFHIAFILASMVLLLIRFNFNNILETNDDVSESYILGFLFIILNLASGLSGWADQYTNGQIIIYTIGCFGIALFFYLKPKHSVFLFTETVIFLLVSIYITQKDNTILMANVGNAIIVSILAIFMSITVSKLMQRYILYKNNLEQIITERTAELEVTNNKLIAEMNERIRLDRLDILGKMAASISHEVRNPLTTVKGFLQLIQMKQTDTKNLEYFDLMIKELDRANSILTEFLSISKTRVSEMDWFSINDIIKNMIPLIEADIHNNELLLSLDLKEVPKLLLDTNEIHQLVLNLTRNGIEAMTKGGCLTIATYSTNQEVFLIIKDEGSGIAPDILEKLGTPFFTTKKSGTGLGLTVCKSIIERHNAKLHIFSSSHGSSFQIAFKTESVTSEADLINVEAV